MRVAMYLRLSSEDGDLGHNPQYEKAHLWSYLLLSLLF